MLPLPSLVSVVVLANYEYTDTNYKTDLVKGGTADTQDNRILAGVSWENTAQTTGKLRLGQGKRGAFKLQASP